MSSIVSSSYTEDDEDEVVKKERDVKMESHMADDEIPLEMDDFLHISLNSGDGSHSENDLSEDEILISKSGQRKSNRKDPLALRGTGSKGTVTIRVLTDRLSPGVRDEELSSSLSSREKEENIRNQMIKISLKNMQGRAKKMSEMTSEERRKHRRIQRAKKQEQATSENESVGPYRKKRISEMTPEEQEKQRQKWREERKRKQLLKKVKDEVISDEEGEENTSATEGKAKGGYRKKRVSELTPEELEIRRQRWREEKKRKRVQKNEGEGSVCIVKDHVTSEEEGEESTSAMGGKGSGGYKKKRVSELTPEELEIRRQRWREEAKKKRQRMAEKGIKEIKVPKRSRNPDEPKRIRVTLEELAERNRLLQEEKEQRRLQKQKEKELEKQKKKEEMAARRPKQSKRVFRRKKVSELTPEQLERRRERERERKEKLKERRIRLGLPSEKDRWLRQFTIENQEELLKTMSTQQEFPGMSEMTPEELETHQLKWIEETRERLERFREKQKRQNERRRERMQNDEEFRRKWNERHKLYKLRMSEERKREISERNRQKRLQWTPEEREEYLQKCKIRYLERKARMTEEKLEEERIKMKINYIHRMARMTPEELERHRQRRNENRKRLAEKMTEEQKLRERMKNREKARLYNRRNKEQLGRMKKLRRFISLDPNVQADSETERRQLLKKIRKQKTNRKVKLKKKLIAAGASETEIEEKLREFEENFQYMEFDAPKKRVSKYKNAEERQFVNKVIQQKSNLKRYLKKRLTAAGASEEEIEKQVKEFEANYQYREIKPRKKKVGESKSCPSRGGPNRMKRVTTTQCQSNDSFEEPQGLNLVSNQTQVNVTKYEPTANHDMIVAPHFLNGNYIPPQSSQMMPTNSAHFQPIAPPVNVNNWNISSAERQNHEHHQYSHFKPNVSHVEEQTWSNYEHRDHSGPSSSYGDAQSPPDSPGYDDDRDDEDYVPPSPVESQSRSPSPDFEQAHVRKQTSTDMMHERNVEEREEIPRAQQQSHNSRLGPSEDRQDSGQACGDVSEKSNTTRRKRRGRRDKGKPRSNSKRIQMGVILGPHKKEVKHVRDQVCDECGNSYSYQYIRRHKRTMHNPVLKNGTCSECGMRFNTTMKLFQHYRKEHREVPVMDVCPALSTGRAKPAPEEKALREVEKRGKTWKYICEECGRGYAIHKHLRRHLNVVHGIGEEVPRSPVYVPKYPRQEGEPKYKGQRPYGPVKNIKNRDSICDECGNAYSSDYLQTHKRNVHHPLLKGGECSICHVKFKASQFLYTHLRKYHPELVAAAELPGTRSKWGLKMPSESVKRKHIVFCEQCGQGFQCRRLLLVHQHSKHSFSKVNDKFICPVCPTTEESGETSFKALITLKFHLRDCHEGYWGLYQCMRCPFRYQTLREMNEHVKKKHEDSYRPCQYCSAVMYSELGLRFHLTSKSCRKIPEKERAKLLDDDNEELSLDHWQLQCEFCEKKFAILELRGHYERQHGITEDLYECTKCHRMDPNRQYMAAHMFDFHGIGAEECKEIVSKSQKSDGKRETYTKIKRGRKKQKKKEEEEEDIVTDEEEEETSTEEEDDDQNEDVNDGESEEVDSSNESKTKAKPLKATSAGSDDDDEDDESDFGKNISEVERIKLKHMKKRKKSSKSQKVTTEGMKKRGRPKRIRNDSDHDADTDDEYTPNGKAIIRKVQYSNRPKRNRRSAKEKDDVDDEIEGRNQNSEESESKKKSLSVKLDDTKLKMNPVVLVHRLNADELLKKDGFTPMYIIC